MRVKAGGWGGGALALLAVLAGCAREPERPVVHAAASIAGAVEEAARAGGAPCRVSPGPSSALAWQIVRGAEPVLFVSAHEEWIGLLAGRGLLEEEEPVVLAGNSLVWAAPAGSGRVGPPGPGEVARIAVGDPAHVPAGRHARAALEAAGRWEGFADAVVPAADARAAAALVARGEVDAGILYASDAAGDARIEVLGPVVPDGAPVVRYLAVVPRGGGAVGRELRAVLQGPAAQRVFVARGFAVEGVPAEGAAGPAAPGLDVGSALRLSLQVAATATLVGLPVAALLGWWLARSRSRWRVVVEALVVLPLVLPPVVVGYALLVLLGRGGVVPTGLPFQWWGAALASFVMALPLLVRPARQAFEAVEPGLEQAAATLGAGRWRIWWTVTLPLARRGLLAGAGLGFARSLGEFGATITFAGNLPGETRTLPLAIWTALQSPDGEGAVWRLALVCVGVSVAAAVASEVLVRRGRGGER